MIAHAPQTWGQWGALVAISVTGLGLTTVRAISRSTSASAMMLSVPVIRRNM